MLSCFFYHTAQKMKLSIKDFFSKCDQIRRKLRIWSHLLKKSLMESFFFCAVSRTANLNFAWILRILTYLSVTTILMLLCLAVQHCLTNFQVFQQYHKCHDFHVSAHKVATNLTWSLSQNLCLS